MTEIRRLKTSEIVIPAGRRGASDMVVVGLAASMALVGLINPITVTETGVLIAGLHRLRAAQRLGWMEIDAIPMTLSEIDREIVEIDENEARNPGTVLEHAKGLRRQKELYEARHPETRHGSHERKPVPGKDETISSLPRTPPLAELPSKPALPRPFAEVAAAKLGASPRTIQHEIQIDTKIAEDVKESLRGTDIEDSKTELLKIARMPHHEQRALVARVTAGAATTVRDAQRLQRREERIESIVVDSAPPSLEAVGTFPVIYADPPWRYEHAKSDSRAIENQYPTMDLAEICTLPVGALATDDAVLLMWTTSPKLAEGMAVVSAWGFTYRTCMVWDKERIGMGYWARQQHELLLIATRGNPPTPAPADRPPSVIRLARPEKHSSKPHEFREMIERMFPKWRRIELFAREARPGWSTWGNQAPKAAE